MRVIVVILAALFSLNASAVYEVPVLKVDIKSVDEESGKGLEGTTIEIYSKSKHDGALLTVVTLKSGSIESVELPINETYTLYFKHEGYVTKMAEINSHSDRPSDLAKTTVVLMQVTMFKAEPSVDLNFLAETPLVKYKFDNKGWMTFDRKYTEEMMVKINEIRGIKK